jgi:low affinity Fe/Cu permease
MIRRCLTQLGVFTAHPLAFAFVGLYALLWSQNSPATFDWHAVATLATWFMTVLIQRATHRDTQAMHAKIDELLQPKSTERSAIAAIFDKEPEEIEKHRALTRDS